MKYPDLHRKIMYGTATLGWIGGCIKFRNIFCWELNEMTITAQKSNVSNLYALWDRGQLHFFP